MKPINVLVLTSGQAKRLKRQNMKKRAIRKKVKALIHREGKWDSKRTNRLRNLNKEYEKTFRERGLGPHRESKSKVKIVSEEEKNESIATKIANMYGEDL